MYICFYQNKRRRFSQSESERVNVALNVSVKLEWALDEWKDGNVSGGAKHTESCLENIVIEFGLKLWSRFWVLSTLI